MSWESDERDRAETERDALKSRVAELENDLEQARAESAFARARVEELEAENGMMGIGLDGLRGSLARMSDDLGAANRRVAELEAELAARDTDHRMRLSPDRLDAARTSSPTKTEEATCVCEYCYCDCDCCVDLARGRLVPESATVGRIVAWLRETPRACGVLLGIEHAQAIARLADAIETGEYRKEGE